MPHLFIMSDEFAELKQQRPEFMDQLISMARIGRSRGIHMIFATQKPAGVVNDQNRSHTKLRVCLRVQEKQQHFYIVQFLDLLGNISLAHATGVQGQILLLHAVRIEVIFSDDFGYIGTIAVSWYFDVNLTELGLDCLWEIVVPVVARRAL